MAKAKTDEKGPSEVQEYAIPIILPGKGKGKKRRHSMSVVVPTVLELEVTVRGYSLLVNRFPEYAIQEIEDKQSGKAKAKKPPKDPIHQYEQAKYKDDDGNECFIGEGFRRSFVEAAVTLSDVSKASLNRELVVTQELIPLEYDTVFMRRDVVKIGAGVSKKTDLRYRPCYLNWSCKVPVRLILNETTLERACSIFKMAGLSIGVGDWRPGAPKGGPFGTYDVEQVEVVSGNVEIQGLEKAA